VPRNGDRPPNPFQVIARKYCIRANFIGLIQIISNFVNNLIVTQVLGTSQEFYANPGPIFMDAKLAENHVQDGSMDSSRAGS
jgi:hypothetical protein